MKKSIAIILAIALTGVMAAAAFASELFKYNGVVKSVNPATSEIVFSGVKAKGEPDRPMPENITIKLTKNDFKRIKSGHEKVSRLNPPLPLDVNVQYEVNGGKYEARTIRIIFGGC
ncbi:MAG: hypothetical protein HZA22_11015 [Nitrospirae bacterium]|nr:hypothetical protein [Nitrospirota bacterium]